MDSPEEVAEAFCAAQFLKMSHGMLVAVPNLEDPAGANVESAIQASIRETEAARITGRDVTPYILKRVNEITKGDSLRSNMALVLQNALVGAEIAIELSRKRSHENENSAGTQWRPQTERKLQSKVIVIGAAIIDLIAKPQEKLLLETSNPATCRESDGGVGRNIAETLGRLGSAPLFYSAVGDDNAGRSMIDRLKSECGVLEPNKTVSLVPGYNTARYLAILDHGGELKVACADVMVVNHICKFPDDDTLGEAKYLVLDANLPLHLLQKLASCAAKLGTAVVFEPTCVPKAKETVSILSHVSYAFPNIVELEAMVDTHSRFIKIEDQMTLVLERMHPSAATLVVTAGKEGVYVASREGTAEPNIVFYSVERVVAAENTTGAGDTFVGAFLHAMVKGCKLEDAVKFSMKAAELSVQHSTSAVSPLLSSTNPML